MATVQATKKPKRISGGKAATDAGKKYIGVLPDADQHATIRAAAGIAGKSMAQFLLDCGLAESEKILEKFRK